jgi:steroid delta-isomerase-like uncharacterized protein
LTFGIDSRRGVAEEASHFTRGGTAVSLDTNKALVQRYYHEVLNQRNLALLDRLCAATFRSYLPDRSSVTVEQYKQAVALSLAAFPDLQVVLHDQIAEGDKVVTRWSAQGSHQGMFAGLPATGKAVTVSAIHIHRVTADRLVEHWEAIDLLGLLQQLGVVPPPGE